MTFKPGQKVNLNGPVGKIASLPSTIRAEVNRQLDNGRNASEILAWLNAQESVRKVLEEKWNGRPINKENVFLWRQRNYPKWLRRRDHIENLKELSDYALRLGQAAGGSVADGSAAIAGGRIMAALEEADGADIHRMVRSISQLRAGDLGRARLAQQDKKLELERKRYQRQTAELFLEWHNDQKAREIVESRDGNAEKIERLGLAMFGEDW